MSAVHDAILSVDVLVLMRDAGARYRPEMVTGLYSSSSSRLPSQPCWSFNKIDKIRDKAALLPLIDMYSKEYDFAEIIPVSALKGDAIDNLLSQIVKHLPEGEPIFGEDEMTNQPVRSIAAEMVREKILLSTGEELPYVTAVVTELYDVIRIRTFSAFFTRSTWKNTRKRR